MDLTLTLLIIAAVLALPGGLFVTYIVSEPRARAVAVLGGIVGDLFVAGGIYYFIAAAHVTIDALSFWLGAFFACSMGVLGGALLANFLVSLSSRSRTPAASHES